MFPDSEQLFDAVIKGQKTSEKRLVIDILATGEVCQRFEVKATGLVPGDRNPSDAFSKLRHDGVLTKLLETFAEKTKVLQWIDRSRLLSSNKTTEAGV